MHGPFALFVRLAAVAGSAGLQSPKCRYGVQQRERAALAFAHSGE